MYRAITEVDQVFHDTDKILLIEVIDGDTVGDPVLDENGHVVSYTGIDAGTAQMKDLSGKELAFTLRKRARSSTALIEKTTQNGGITIVGVYDSDRSVNTQRVAVRIDDTDTYDPDGSPVVNVKPSTSYAYALKQTTEGEERILLYGPFTLLQAAAWE